MKATGASNGTNSVTWARPLASAPPVDRILDSNFDAFIRLLIIECNADQGARILERSETMAQLPEITSGRCASQGLCLLRVIRVVLNMHWVPPVIRSKQTC